MKKVQGSVLAGVLIGIGGAVNMMAPSRFVGAAMFCVGLYMICIYQAHLYTGKVGYVINNLNGKYLLYLVGIFVGNFTGAALTGLYMGIINPGIIEIAQNTVAIRTAQTVWQTLLSSMFCGVLVHLSVNQYKQNKIVLPVFLCVTTFILCGFEHCVADMFIFALALTPLPITLRHILLVALGNSVGGILASLNIDGKLAYPNTDK